MATDTATSPGSQPDYAPLNSSERKAYRELADINADEQGMMPIAARTLKRLLAQVSAQEQQIKLHERREKGFRELGQAWQTMGPDFEDYQDAATEVIAVLDNPHYGDPAYADHEPEHDGQGWCAPRPTLKSNL